MSRPGWFDEKAKHNKAWGNADDDSLVEMGDLPVNINDYGEEDDFETRFVDEDETDIEDMVDSLALLSEGVAETPRAMYPHQYVRENELNSYGEEKYGK